MWPCSSATEAVQGSYLTPTCCTAAKALNFSLAPPHSNILSAFLRPDGLHLGSKCSRERSVSAAAEPEDADAASSQVCAPLLP
jgi:hypothetical protein